MQAFRFFDRDGNGSISTAEFESVMTELGEDRLTQEECSLFIKLIDKDGDHEVSGPTGRERLVSPTLHTLQFPILLPPWVCFAKLRRVLLLLGQRTKLCTAHVTPGVLSRVRCVP